MLSFTADHIVSISDLLKKFKTIRSRLTETGYLTVFNANKPDVVIADLALFERLMDAEEKYEQLEMYLSVQEAKARNKLVPLDLSEFD